MLCLMTVRLWDSHLCLISKYTTNDVFSHDELLDNGDGGDEEEWPPFRKVLFSFYDKNNTYSLKSYNEATLRRLEFLTHTRTILD